MKTYLAAGALALLSLLLVLTPATAQAAGCDCQKELRAFMDAQDKVADLQREIAKIDGKIIDAESDVDRQKQEAEKLQRQLQGTLDLLNRAAKKGANVDSANLQSAVNDAKKEVADAIKELQRRIDKANDLKKQKDALEAKLKQAQADESAAGKAYTACRHRCAAAGPEKPKGEPPTEKHVHYFFDPRFGDLDNMKSQCTACDAAYEKLQKAESDYAAAQKAYQAADHELQSATREVQWDEAQRKHDEAEVEAAGKSLGQIGMGLMQLGAKDIYAVMNSELVKEAQKVVDEVNKHLLYTIQRLWRDEAAAKKAKDAFDKASKALDAADKAMTDAAAALEQCNAGCYKHGSSHSGLIPGLSFGFGMGMGGGDHHRGGDDVPHRRD